MTAPTSFGAYLRQTREAAHLSQRALAERLGVSFPYLCHVERGERPPLVPARWPALIAIGADPEQLRALSIGWKVAALESRIAALHTLPEVANSDTLTP